MKKFLSIFLAVVIVLASVPIASNASTNGITQSQAVDWANSQIGKSLDYDGVYDAQCVDLIKYYYSYLGVSPVSGNGCDYATNSRPSGWSRIQYYSGFVPQPGDIAVWTYTTSSNGHVAIITSANASTMYVVEQNGSTHVTRSHSYSYSYGTFYGVIRPDFSSADSTKEPEILSLSIKNVTKAGYTAECIVDDASSITLADFLVWTENNGQDDINSNKGTINGNTISVNIKSSDHNNEQGKYITHLYLHYNGTSKGVALPSVVLNDVTGPQFVNLTISDVSKNGYTAKCTVKDESSIIKGDFMVWTENNGQDDMNCNSGTIIGHTISTYINVSEHNNELGKYNTHIYVYDANWNCTSAAFPIVDLSETTPPVVSNIEISNVSSLGYTATCTVEDDAGVVKGDFMVWTTDNGQDDMNCNGGIIDGNTITVNIKSDDHNGEQGEYITHLYVFDGLGNSVGYAFPKVNLSGYTVEYINQDNSVFESLIKQYETDIEIIDTYPTRVGYIFKEWNTTADGSGVSYQPGDTYSENADLTLYAIWEHDTFNLISYSPLTYDAVNKFIYGSNLSSMTAEGIADIFNNTNTVVNTNDGVLATGTTVNLVDDTNTTYDTATVVVFGDVNGDGCFNGEDSIVVSAIVNGCLSKDSLTQAELFAADCNHDNVIDSNDIVLLEQAGLLNQTVKQEI